MSFGGPELLFAFLPVLFLLGVILAVVAGVASRREADPKGRRPYALYLLAVMFVSLFTTVGALTGATNALVRGLIEVDDVVHSYQGAELEAVPVGGIAPPSPPVVESFSPADRTLAEVLGPLIVAIVAAVLFVFHRRRFNELLARETADG